MANKPDDIQASTEVDEAIDDDKITGAEDDIDDQVDADDSDAASNDPGADDEGAGDDESDGDEVVVSIGEEPLTSDEEDAARAPGWLPALRKSNRDKTRRIRELEQQLAAATPAPQAVSVGVKPTLESCEFDPEKFETELEAWHTRKREVDEQEAKKSKAEAEQRAAWQSKLDAYGKAKGALKVKDFEDAEAVAQDTLSVVQQGVILNGADNPAVLVYALGRNPKKAKELAAISDPVKFAFAVAKLETQLKVTPKKTAPVPERAVRGSAPIAGTVDSTLTRLRLEAEKTGDYSKVHQYRQQQRQKRAA